jgi:NAD(P)H-hydrate epimerase
MQTMTRAQVRRFDQLAIERLGIPGVVLMENAGRQVADAVLDLIELDLQLIPSDATVAVLCGGGNNGGDGYVIARHLHNQGARVRAYAFKAIDQLQGDAAVHARIVQRMGLVEAMDDQDAVLKHESQVLGSHVLVDALLGTGFAGGVRPEMARAIGLCLEAKQRGARVVAVDLPSGLDCDTGQPATPCVQADVTVTFVARKVGFDVPEAAEFIGEVIVADIGAPMELAES